MFSKVFFALALAAMSVGAQNATTSSDAAASTSTALAGISACVIECVSSAAVLDGCSSFTDVTCVCSSAQFIVDATACLTEHCTTADLAAAVGLQTSQCTAAGIAVTGTAGAANSVPFSTPASSSTAAGSSSTAASATTTTKAAVSTSTTPSSSTASTSASTTSASSAANVVVASGPLAFIGAVIAGALVL
ncbi:hypothetical protein HYPSUDRAFT_219505 [Hypholoma sublateritium FD-334 SS-4]|uniref:CFEM domain-containing protein n=1 Tax=Hypholoma sublateritium (strain FD-334 SS-4) TaxID=945553 RepID=A0A0D2NIG1_HYPSF|nr:hypothetical protein HYPSUDRAFT_219505 [Hypholoma sublateritium FD-334 SS-4]